MALRAVKEVGPLLWAYGRVALPVEAAVLWLFVGGRGMAIVVAALSGTCACSQETTWVAPPESPLTSALVARVDGSELEVRAQSLEAGSPLVFELVREDAKIEVALFEQDLEALGLVAGLVSPSEISDPLRADDANLFLRLALDRETPTWEPLGALSSAFGAFALPVVRPPEPCPRFEVEPVVMLEPALLYTGARGPGDSMIFGGQEIVSSSGDAVIFGDARYFLVGIGGEVREIQVEPPAVLVSGLASEGAGYWGDAEAQVHRGVYGDGVLRLTPVASPLPSRVQAFAGSLTSSTGLYALTLERRSPNPVAATLHQFDGGEWQVVVELPVGGDQTIAHRDGETVLVSDVLPHAVHTFGNEVRELRLPDVANLVAFVPGYGFLAAERRAIMQYTSGQNQWTVLSGPAPGGIRVRALVPFKDGFVAVYDSAVAFWSPELGRFCPLFEIAWSDLSFAENVGGALFVYPNADRESRSMRVLILRDRR